MGNFQSLPRSYQQINDGERESFNGKMRTELPHDQEEVFVTGVMADRKTLGLFEYIRYRPGQNPRK